MTMARKSKRISSDLFPDLFAIPRVKEETIEIPYTLPKSIEPKPYQPTQTQIIRHVSVAAGSITIYTIPVNKRFLITGAFIAIGGNTTATATIDFNTGTNVQILQAKTGSLNDSSCIYASYNPPVIIITNQSPIALTFNNTGASSGTGGIQGLEEDILRI